MSRVTHAGVNAALRRAGLVDPARGEALHLRAGRGYQYFTYAAPGRWETGSVYVYNVDAYTVEQWLAEARDFLATVGGGVVPLAHEPRT